ncbi:hypothetical protein MMC07_000006 [Pseudocyphellaria aurata]|nr:hypothetical protein [Pseudocyphellaria aurata]
MPPSSPIEHALGAEWPTPARKRVREAAKRGLINPFVLEENGDSGTKTRNSLQNVIDKLMYIYVNQRTLNRPCDLNVAFVFLKGWNSIKMEFFGASVFDEAIVSNEALVASVSTHTEFWRENLTTLQKAYVELNNRCQALEGADEQLANARDALGQSRDALNQAVGGQNVFKSQVAELTEQLRLAQLSSAATVATPSQKLSPKHPDPDKFTGDHKPSENLSEDAFDVFLTQKNKTLAAVSYAKTTWNTQPDGSLKQITKYRAAANLGITAAMLRDWIKSQSTLESMQRGMRETARRMTCGTPFPQVAWAANDRRLTWELSSILEDNSFLKRAIWPAPGDATAGKTKTTTYKELAERFFGGENSEYRKHVRGKAGKQFNSQSIKRQVGRIQDAFKKAKVQLGVTGAGLLSEDDIWPDSEFLINTLKSRRIDCSIKVRRVDEELTDAEVFRVVMSNLPMIKRNVFYGDDFVQKGFVPIRRSIEMKNNRKRQRDTDIQDQTTKQLRLTHQHKITLKRMELNIKAAERAHERWMKEVDLGMHRPEKRKPKII